MGSSFCVCMLVDVKDVWYGVFYMSKSSLKYISTCISLYDWFLWNFYLIILLTSPILVFCMPKKVNIYLKLRSPRNFWFTPSNAYQRHRMLLSRFKTVFRFLAHKLRWINSTWFAGSEMLGPWQLHGFQENGAVEKNGYSSNGILVQKMLFVVVIFVLIKILFAV